MVWKSRYRMNSPLFPKSTSGLLAIIVKKIIHNRPLFSLYDKGGEAGRVPNIPKLYNLKLYIVKMSEK